MDKHGQTVVITQDILLKHANNALDNLNKIHQLSPTLMMFAVIYAAEICNTFFDSEKEN